MKPRSPDIAGMAAECTALLAHWESVRGKQLTPKRSQIEPGAIRSLLPFISILESTSPTETRFRLAGTALRDLFGLELTGRNIVDLAPPSQRRLRGYRLWSQMRVPCGSVFARTITFTCGSKEDSTGIMLPLTPDREGAAPLSICIEIPRHGRRWINARTSELLESADTWDFLDIGAGVPELLHPPADWPPSHLLP